MALTYVQCAACEDRLWLSDVVRSGRNRRYCSDRCRQAGLRARRADPEAWARKQSARERRQANRERRAESKAQEHVTASAWTDATDSVTFRYDEPENEMTTADPRVAKLLARALDSDSEHEAAACLAKARALHTEG